MRAGLLILCIYIYCNFVSALPISYKRLEPVTNVVKEFSGNWIDKRDTSTSIPSNVELSFSGFGKEFSFNLKLESRLTDDAVVEIYGENDELIETQPLKPSVYRGFFGSNWASINFHSDGLFHGLIFQDGELYIVDPVSRHSDGMDATEKRELSMADMVIYKESELLDDTEHLCGSVSFKNKRSSTPQNETVIHPRTNLGRQLLTVSRWTNCFPGDTVTKKFVVAFSTDYGYYLQMGSNAQTTKDAILDIVASSNIIYYVQVNVYLVAGTIDIRTSSGGLAWNLSPPCPGDINSQLNDYTAWRKTQKVPNNGVYHLLTNCYPPPGTVGLAWVGVLCGYDYGAGVSSHSSSTWKTVAHEVGHNFGAQHTFQNGQGKTGGIMDYGDGTLNGEYQFNSQYNKAEVCAEITSSMNNPQVQNCWSDFKSTCGNGIIEPGESCDDSSSCCVSCLLASNAECSGGPCCDNCKFALTTKNCGTQGYCASGVCTQSKCAQYSNLNFCSVSSTNACQQTCAITPPGTSCSLLSSFNVGGVPLDGSIADGTPCGSSPSKVCSAGQCVLKSEQTQGWVVGEWGPCNGPCGNSFRSRTVTCPGNCPSTKPDSTIACSNCPLWANNGSYTPCSVCDKQGTQSLIFTCTTPDGAPAADSVCANVQKPDPGTRTCQISCQEAGMSSGNQAVAIGVSVTVVVLFLVAVAVGGFFLYKKKMGSGAQRKGLATESTFQLNPKPENSPPPPPVQKPQKTPPPPPPVQKPQKTPPPPPTQKSNTPPPPQKPNSPPPFKKVDTPPPPQKPNKPPPIPNQSGANKPPPPPIKKPLPNPNPPTNSNNSLPPPKPLKPPKPPIY